MLLLKNITRSATYLTDMHGLAYPILLCYWTKDHSTVEMNIALSTPGECNNPVTNC